MSERNPKRSSSRCKGPESQKSLTCLKDRKKANLAGMQCIRKKVKEDEVREARPNPQNTLKVMGSQREFLNRRAS